jgi:uncharacterized protein (TIGR02246 family)
MNRTLKTLRAALGLLSLSVVVLAAAAPARAAGAGDAKEQDAVKKAHKQWTDALSKRDAAAAEAVLLEDYAIVDPSGRPNSRKFIVDGLRGGQLKIESVDVADTSVRVIGSTAIVVSVQTLKGTYDDNEIGGRYRVTDVLVKQDGKWKLAAGHMTRLEE